MRQSKVKKVLWSVDPFSELPRAFKRSLEALRALDHGQNLLVEPVYVLGSDGLNWVGNIAAPDIKRFVPMAELAMEKLFRNVKDPFLLKPKVLINKMASRRGDIKILQQYALRSKVDLILANTHARKGFDRVLLGSFAENLLFHSKVPLLFVSPHTKPIKSLGQILFPTDFSKSSLKVFKGFLSQINDIGKKVLLLNKVVHPADAFIQSGVALVGGGWVSIDEFFKGQEKERTETGKSWAKWAKAKGLQSKVIVAKGPSRISESILETSKKLNVNMIAMASEAGPVSSLLVGNIAREVIRGSAVPVWVMQTTK